MKVKIIECCHELDLEDELNDFLKNIKSLISIQYEVSMCYSTELEYSFSCLIIYE